MVACAGGLGCLCGPYSVVVENTIEGLTQMAGSRIKRHVSFNGRAIALVPSAISPALTASGIQPITHSLCTSVFAFERLLRVI